MHNTLGSDAEPKFSKDEFDSIRERRHEGAASTVFEGGVSAVGTAQYIVGEGFNSYCLDLLLPLASAGFGCLGQHAIPSNAAKVEAMLDTGLVLGLVLHLPGHWVAFRQQNSGAFVHLDSSNQEAYPETAMHSALQQPPTLGTSHDVFVQLLNLLDATPNDSEGEQCYFLFKSGSKDIVKAAGYEAGRAARLSARGGH